jgi:hypothetical protein
VKPKAAKGRTTSAERNVKLVAKANKKISKATAAPQPAKQAAKTKKITGKAALVTQPAKETMKADKIAMKTTVQRTAKASAQKVKSKRVTAARKASPKATTVVTHVAPQRSAVRSVASGPVRRSIPTAPETSDRRPSQVRYRSPVDPPSDEIETDSQDSFPASDAPSWTSITRIGRPIPPKRE